MRFTADDIKQMYFDSTRVTIEDAFKNQEGLLGMVPDNPLHGGVITVAFYPEFKVSPFVLDKNGLKIDQMPCTFMYDESPRQGYIYSVDGSYFGKIIRRPLKEVSKMKHFFLGRDAERSITDIVDVSSRNTMALVLQSSELVYPLYDPKIIQQKFANAMDYMPPF